VLLLLLPLLLLHEPCALLMVPLLPLTFHMILVSICRIIVFFILLLLLLQLLQLLVCCVGCVMRRAVLSIPRRDKRHTREDRRC
jgi:hypothetical protein